MSHLKNVVKKLNALFSRYPNEKSVNPKSFRNLPFKICHEGHANALALQSVSDKFYYLLFGAIRMSLGARVPLRVDLLVVSSINGAVGVGWWASLKRSAVIAYLRTNLWVRAYEGVADRLAYRSAAWTNPLHDFEDWRKSKRLWEQMQKNSFSLQVEGIEIADLIVDSYLRFKPSPQFDATNPFVRRLIWQSLRDIRKGSAYFKSARPRWYLTSYTTYLEHGIPARVALRHGIDVWSFGSLNKFGKKLTATDTFHTPDFSKYKSDFEVLDTQEERLEAARKQLDIRLSGGIDDATSYMRRSAYGSTQSQLPAGLKGSAILFLHDFYDSPHVYPDLVFQDFWSWTCTTIDLFKKRNTPFFLKPHPNQIPQSDEVIKRLQLQYPDLRWLSSDISNLQLAKAGIACGITVYGTVAHELAYLGIPSIGCARHPHHAFDFCRTAGNIFEYEQLLKTCTELPISVAEMRSQALVFYYMHNLHGDEDTLALRRAFVAFWVACNAVDSAEDHIINKFYELAKLPSFDRFIKSI